MTSAARIEPHAHLSPHRRMIVGRSVAVGLAGMLPIPFLDDWLAAAIRRGAVRRIASERGLRLDGAAVRALADGGAQPPAWRSFLNSGVTVVLRKAWRRTFFLLVVANRAETIAHTFAILTLTDHVAARLHGGASLDAAQAAQLRSAMDDAFSRAGKDTVVGVVRQGLQAAVHATARSAPFEVIDEALHGALRRLLELAPDEIRAEAAIDSVLDSLPEVAAEPLHPGSLAARHPFLARGARAVERELSVVATAYLDNLVRTFEASEAVTGQGTPGRV